MAVVGVRRRKKRSEEEIQETDLQKLIDLKDEYHSIKDDFLEEESSEYSYKILDISARLQNMCEQNADLLLAYFQLNREDDYEVIQPLYSGVICELISAKKMVDKNERKQVIAAALTHDIGMHTLKDIVSNREVPLTPDQLADLKLHPLRAIKYLRNSGVKDDIWIKSVQQHHERLDGSGYPHGLKDQDISVGAKIIAIADIFIAMTKPHANREGAIPKQALTELFTSRGEKVDNELTQMFIRDMGFFPPGSVVKLMNGDIALVTHRGKSATQPIVQSIIGPRGAPFEKPVPRNTSHNAFAVKDLEPDEQYRKIAFDLAVTLWKTEKIHFSSS
ncbi:MAG: HD domain-containing protein [Gammaproteobacteria bacterium]|nr:MAG: HD domain-containing protein [Gammaproteobacteria bacterium]